MDDDTLAQLAQLRQERGLHIRRLGLLRAQAARLGGDMPPAVAMEIEDIQALIDQLGGRISSLDAAALMQQRRRIIVGDSPIDPALRDLWHYVLGMEDDLKRQIMALVKGGTDNDAARAAGQQRLRRYVIVAIVLLVLIAVKVWL